jgi:hypothetical protein
MKRIGIFVLSVAVLCGTCLAQQCGKYKIDSAEAAIHLLSRMSPKDTAPSSRKCIENAIDVVSGLLSKDAIPELVRYLPFRRDTVPGEGTEFMLHPSFEDSVYPAVAGLARMGSTARPALLDAIESDSSSSEIRQNAIHALALSFMLEPDHDPGGGILYLRDAERSTRGLTKKKLERAVVYMLTTYPCRRFPAKCRVADKKSSLQ